ncbi:MAG: hypothetical protein HQL53_04935 [Magnetococcales bacterium]|nr:hypothetical protein [Magnetococcales bacterium]
MTKRTRFERFSKNFVLALITITLILGLLEGAAFLWLKSQGLLVRPYQYFQTISGYHVFKTTPGQPLWKEMKAHPDDPTTFVDGNGFFSDGPVLLRKAPDVYRIFIMGGSAAYGTGQFPPFAKVHRYREGNLSYRLGIAGQLKRYLQAQRPDLRIEVINAAAVDRTLHQSMLYYLETVSRFSPDLLINLDGYNDLLYSLTSGRPYAELEMRLDFYIDLLNNARAYRPHLMQTMMLLYNRYLHPHINRRLKERFLATDDLDHPRYNLAAYKPWEPAFIERSQRLQQILNHYMAVLKADKVDLLFSLQPILYRQVNKTLSKIEDTMRRTLFSWNPNAPEQARTPLILMSKYFFGHYLSQALQQRVERQGYGFLDLNEEIRHLKRDVELYVDYCHFTPSGSRIVAEILGRKVLDRLPPPRS